MNLSTILPTVLILNMWMSQVHL